MPFIKGVCFLERVRQIHQCLLAFDLVHLEEAEHLVSNFLLVLKKVLEALLSLLIYLALLNVVLVNQF